MMCLYTSDAIGQLHGVGVGLHLRGVRGGDSARVRAGQPALRDHAAARALPGRGRGAGPRHQVTPPPETHVKAAAI